MSAGSPVIEQLIEVRDYIDTSRPRPYCQDWCTTCGWDGSGEHILKRRTQFKTADEQARFLRGLEWKDESDESDEPPLYDRSIGPPSYDQWWAKKGSCRSENEVRNSATAGNICCAVLLSLTLLKGRNLYFEITIDDTWLFGFTKEWHMFTSCEGPPPLQGIPHLSPGSHLPDDTGSPEALAWAKARIEECISSHPCSSFLSPTRSLPSRLIDIGGEPEIAGVVLRNTGNLSSETRYTALSHCWGGVKPKCMTTSKNYDRQCQNIPWADIPRTFREAIQFTQRLDIRYIWIDSVCIIQPEDDENQDDWQHESVRMADYYYNAYVTLAAAFAADCEGGLSSKRPDRKQHLFNATIEGKSCQFFAFRKSRDISSGKLKSSLPLVTRGWAFQERLVSCRVLYFTRNQLIFECFRDAQLEERSYYTCARVDPNLKQSYWNLLNKIAGLDGWPVDNWQTIVEDYSVLRLTKPGDRLPAMAAIAQQVLSQQGPEGRLGSAYLCGLRAGSLHEDLTWWPYNEPPQKQDIQHLAPSWSWASYPGKVHYDNTSFGFIDYKSEIELIGDSLEFTASGRFGACTGGYITIKAPVIDCIWKVRLDSEGYLKEGQILLLDPHSSPEKRAMILKPDFRAGYQDLEGLNDGNEVKVRVILVCQGEPGLLEQSIWVLVLYQSTKTKLYRRLGLTGQYLQSYKRKFPSYTFQTDSDLESQFAKAERRTIKMA